MSKLQAAIGYLHEIDIESENRRKHDSINETAVFLVTVFYVITLVSIDKYLLDRLLSMCVYLVAVSVLEDISLIRGISRIKYIIILILLVGIANPIIDREIVYTINNIPITGGMLSFFTLFLKGVFSLLACYIMAVRIGIIGVARALYTLKAPNVIINVCLLIHRYIIVFLKETDKLSQAYRLRSYGKKGVSIKGCGAFVGLMLLRSVDRAEEVRESMLLRGYSEDSFLFTYEKKSSVLFSVLYVVFWCVLFLILRSCDVLYFIGDLLR